MSKKKNIILKLIDEMGVWDTKKIMGITLTQLVKLADLKIHHGLANEIIIDNIDNGQLPKEYKEFKISTNTDGVVYWEGKFYGEHFLPNMVETIWVMATPFWDGMKTTPVETDWYSLVDTSNDTLIAEIEGGGDYYQQLDGVELFSNVDDLFSWYNKVYLPGVHYIIMNDFLPNLQQDMDDRLDDNMGYGSMKESIVRVLEEERSGKLTESQLLMFNKVLNKKLSQDFPWWFEGIELSRAGMNDNQNYLYMDGKIYVDADWIGEQWRKYNDYKPFPEFGTDYDEYGFGDLIGINDGWLDILKETFISVFHVINGGNYPKYLSFSWLNVIPVESKKEEDMNDNNFLKEHIRNVIQEEISRKYMKHNEKIEKLILDKLNNIFSDLNMYHVKSYNTRHDFEFCKNGKKMMNLVLFFGTENGDNKPTSELEFNESTLFIPKEFVNDILRFIPIRKNYLLYLIEEWFEDKFLNEISNKMGRDDISVDELEFTDRIDVCVPPITEKPEGVTQDDMISYIMKSTLFKRNELLKYEDREPGYIEHLYLAKLRNAEMDRLKNNG